MVLQFQRAVESITAAQVWDSARQYVGTARDFLIYLGEDHPTFRSLDQLRRDPHILGPLQDSRDILIQQVPVLHKP